MPLVFILMVGMFKDAWEDYQRHKSDSIENSRTTLLCQGDHKRVAWRDLKVGQVVKILNRELMPADVVILSTSNDDGLCHTMTANLDGETNLKLRQVAGGDLVNNAAGTPEDRGATAKGSVQCDLPNKYLHHFEGTFTDSAGAKTAVGPSNIMLRGTQLRNTAWILGVIIYTGAETKLQMNNIDPPYKTSTLNGQVNRQTGNAFLVQLTLCLLGAVAGGIYVGSDETQNSYYLSCTSTRGMACMSQSNLDGGMATFIQFWTFILIFTNYIPISLLVTSDMVKFFSAIMISWDIEMYDAPSDTPMLVRCSDLSEELGQVEHVFSDKTGTLTCNLMEFARCTINGVKYGQDLTTVDPALLAKEPETPNVGVYAPALRAILENKQHPSYQDCFDFFLHLACNHTVMPEHPDGPDSLVYSAASPDEEALVNAAAHYGIKFVDRTTKQISLTVNGESVVYDILHTLEFNSDRKRSSVLLRLSSSSGKGDSCEVTKEVLMFTKGADNIIKQRLSSSDNDAASLATCDQHIIDYSRIGLRTLMVARRRIAPDLYTPWAQKYHEAETAMEGRAQRMDTLMDEIENELFLLGATAIEDKLQDGVPDAIRCLRDANIKVWVLTGDKVDTAISIAGTAQLFLPEMALVRMCAEDNLMELDKKGVPVKEAIIATLQAKLSEARSLEVSKKMMGLVVDSAALEAVQASNLGDVFLELCAFCKSVVCARVTPDQKGQVVTLVRNTKNRPVTLAIGDGANDVNMIQKAQIGVGISGQEGLQAVNSSDFAIAQFRFLKKLLLVHGRQSLRRMSLLACYMFYKNGVMVMPQFFFGFFSQFSGQPIYADAFYQIFNITFTSMPILIFTVFDQDVSSLTAMANPVLYLEGQSGVFFNHRKFWQWMLEAMSEGAVIVFFAFAAYGSSVTFSDGLSTSSYDNGTLCYLAVIHMVTFRLCMEVKTWNWIYVFFLTGSYVLWFIIHMMAQGSIGVSAAPSYMSDVIGSWRIYSGYFYATVVLLFGMTICTVVPIMAWSVMFKPEVSLVYREHQLGKGGGSSNGARVYAEVEEKKSGKDNSSSSSSSSSSGGDSGGGGDTPQGQYGSAQGNPKLEPLTSVDPKHLSPRTTLAQ